MTLSSPFSHATFADRLKILSVKWRLERWDEMSGMGNGDVLIAQLAPPRWRGEVSMQSMPNAEASQVQALIEALDGAINNFYLYAPQSMYPQSDPFGLMVAGSTVSIHTVGVNNKSLRLQGLPVGYVLTVGDFLSFDYGSNPTRRAFHRIVETVTAAGTGITPLFEVRPHLRPGVITSLDVTLVKPSPKVFIVPGTFDPGTASRPVTSGMSFEVMQRP